MMKKLFKRIYQFIPLKKQVFSLLRKAKLPHRVYQHLHFKGVFTVPVNGHAFKIMHSSHQLENELFWEGFYGRWEKTSLALWVKLCKQSQVIFDIGANTGVYSLSAKTVHPSAEVYGFEPVKRVFDKYRQNCILNRFNIYCEPLAISDFDGEAMIYDTPTEHVYSASLDKYYASQRETVRVPVQTKRLDSYIQEKNIKQVDLIKIDVERHEPQLLLGMGRYLAEFKPTLLIEVLTDEIGEKIQSFVSDKGYVYFEIDETNGPLRKSEITRDSGRNYLICQPRIARDLGLI